MLAAMRVRQPARTHPPGWPVYNSMHTRIISLLLLSIMAAVANAQSNPVYVQLGPAKGALYKPDEGPAPRVGILIAHRSGNFMSHIGNRELARRGFMVLGLNTRFENN